MSRGTEFAGEFGRVRGWRTRQSRKDLVRLPSLEFVNPYPWMSAVEARIHLVLEHLHVPFSWRYFDGYSPNMTELLPTFTPEFTLSEYNIVILVLGNYYGTLPGVLDMNALAQAALEYDGWTVAVLWEDEVVRDATVAVLNALPVLRAPTISGESKPNPYGLVPDYLSRRRLTLASQALKRRKFFDPERQAKDRYSGNRRSPRRSRDRRTRSFLGEGRKNPA